jgi:hypothetical protein
MHYRITNTTVRNTITFIFLSIIVAAFSGLHPSYRLGCCENPSLVLYGKGFPLPYYLYPTVWNPIGPFPKINFMAFFLDFLFF